MTIPNYDSWKLSNPDDTVEESFYCDHCSKGVYKGDEFVITVDGYRIHSDCFDEYARTHLISSMGVAGEDE